MNGPGRAQPHNVDSEMCVLGGVLLRNEALDYVSDLLAPDDFYLPSHQEIYRAMQGLADRRAPIDPITIEAELQGRGTLGMSGGIVYLGEVQARVPTAENIEYYARNVYDLSTMRRLIQSASEIAAEAYAPRGELREFLDQAAQRIFDLSQAGSTSYRNARDVLRRAFARAQAWDSDPRAVTGVSWGLGPLDDWTSGLHPGEVAVVGARPSVGKTAFALQVARRAAAAGHPSLFFSVEMTEAALGTRLLASTAEVDSARMRAGKMGEAEWSRTVAAHDQTSPLLAIDDESDSVDQVVARARRFRSDRAYFPPGAAPAKWLVVIDYLQLLRGRGQTTNDRVAYVSSTIKSRLAKGLGACVLALAQLNRAVEDREDGPRLSDLRDSGCVEQDADVVSFLHRSKKTDIVNWILAKQRNGPLTSPRSPVRLFYNKELTTFALPPPATASPAESGEDF